MLSPQDIDEVQPLPTTNRTLSNEEIDSAPVDFSLPIAAIQVPKTPSTTSGISAPTGRQPTPPIINTGRQPSEGPVGGTGNDEGDEDLSVTAFASPILRLPANLARTSAYLGNVARAAPADIATGPSSQFGGNVQAAVRGERTLPIDTARELSLQEKKEHPEGSFWPDVAANISQGVAKTAPKLLAIHAVGPSLLAQGIVAGGLFGLDDNGNFKPKDALIGALLPAVGKVGAKAAGAVIGKMLASGGAQVLTNPVAQKAVETLGEQTAMNAFMGAMNAPELKALYDRDKDEFQKQLTEQIAMGLGFALVGVGKFRKGIPSETQEWIRSNAEALSKKEIIGSISPEKLNALFERVQAGTGTADDATVARMITQTISPEATSVRKGVVMVGQEWPKQLAAALGIPERYGYAVPSAERIPAPETPAAAPKRLLTDKEIDNVQPATAPQPTGGISAVNPIVQSGSVSIQPQGTTSQRKEKEGASPGNRVPGAAGQPSETAPTSGTPSKAPPASPTTLMPAIVTEDGQTLTGISHATIRQEASTNGIDAITNAKEGFVDEKGNFVDRKDGAKWFEQKTGKQSAMPGELHSEDLRDAGLVSISASTNEEPKVDIRETPKSSTQLTLPPQQAKPFTDFAKSIPDSEVYHKADESGKEDYGVETDPHITVLYGLTEHAPEKVAAIFATKKPITVTLGKLSVFEGKDYDVLKVDVHGKDLHDLNSEIAKLPNEQTHPTYQPHLTIAYLKKGEGKQYVGDDRFDGQKLTFNSVTFSPPKELRANVGRPELNFSPKETPTAEGKPIKEPIKAAASPKKAVAKVEKAIDQTVVTEGAKTAKEAKSQLVEELERAIEKAPNEKDLKGGYTTIWGRHVETPDKEPTILTINIPGDGEFKIKNTKEALGEVLAKAKRLSTTKGDTGRGKVSAQAVRSSERVLERQEKEKAEAKATFAAQKLSGEGHVIENARASIGGTAIAVRTVDQLKAILPHIGLRPHQQAILSEFLDSPLGKMLPNATAFLVSDVLDNGWQGSWIGNTASLLRGASPETGPHELVHALWEKVLPQEIKDEAERIRKTDIDEQIKEAQASGAEDRAAALTDLRDNPSAGADDFMARGYPSTLLKDIYPYSSAEEFLAHSLSNRFKQRSGSIVTGFWDRVKQIVGDFIRWLKKALRLKPTTEQWLDSVLKGEFDPAKGPPLERPAQASLSEGKGVPHVVFGEEDTITARPQMTAETIERSIKLTEALAAKSGIGTRRLTWIDPNDGTAKSPVLFEPTGFEMNAEFRKLLTELRQQLAQLGGPDRNPDLVANLLASVSANFKLGKQSAMWDLDPQLRQELYSTARGQISATAMLLGAQNMHKPDVTWGADNLDVVLHGFYWQAYGGEQVDGFVQRILEQVPNFFTDAEIQKILDGKPDLAPLVEQLIALSQKDEGGRVYRRVQYLLKPKQKKRIDTLEKDAQVKEAVEDILQKAAGIGIKPKPSPNKPLTPLQSLLTLVNDKNAARVSNLIETAFKQAHYNAGVAAWRKDAAAKGQSGDAEARIETGERPSDDYVQQGLNLPEFAHWGNLAKGAEKIGNLLGYSPVTTGLVEDLLKSDFRGARFGKPVERSADTRIDLNALAKSPADEARRVLDAYTQNVDANIGSAGASDDTRLRISEMIKQQVALQLAAAKQRVLDNFFNPKTNPPKTASARLRELLNAGVDTDPRFKEDRVRQLVKRVANQQLDATQLTALATSTRAEKQQWLETKAEEIAQKENFNALPEATADYMRAVVWTHLAERLQSAEESVARSFLSGTDKTFEPKPITPESRERSLETAKLKLEGILRAGGTDAAIVEQVSRKSAVQRLVPNATSIAKDLLQTPFYRQTEIIDRFAQRMAGELGIDPAQVDKLQAIFQSAMDVAMPRARARALQMAEDSMTPQERKWLKRSTFEKIKRLFNADALSAPRVLEELARSKGHPVPKSADTDKLRALVEQEQRLFEPTTEQIESATGDEAKLKAFRDENAAINEDRRVKIISQINRIYAKYTQPVTPKFWKNREATAWALNEYATGNVLFKVGFPFRITTHILGQLALCHIPFRPFGVAAAAIARGKRAGVAFNGWKAFHQACADQFKGFIDGMRPGILAAQGALTTGGQRNVDRLKTGVMAFERMAAKAEEYAKVGNWPAAGAIWLLHTPKYILRLIGAVDALQGKLAEYAELRHQVRNWMREQNRNEAEIVATIDRIFGRMNEKRDKALLDAEMVLSAPTALEIARAAENLMRARIFQEMRALTMPVDDFRDRNDYLLKTLAWQHPVDTGVGGAFAIAGKALRAAMAKAGIPAFPLSFSNAIGNGVNFALLNSPFYALAGFQIPGVSKGPSPFFKDEEDRWQRRAQAFTYSVFGGVIAWMVLHGIIRVWVQAPKDKRERALWDREGHRVGTFEIVHPDGSFHAISMTVGPGALLAPALASSGALKDALDRRATQQQKLNAEAEKLGLQPGKIPPMDSTDALAIMAQAGWGTLMGNKALSGIVQSGSEFGIPSIKKASAAFLSAPIWGVPGWQEAMRGAGVVMDPSRATVWDYLTMLPTSHNRMVNFLGDPVGTPDDVQRWTQTMTAGSYPFAINPKANLTAPYAALLSSGYRPPSIDPRQGYAINGEFRPLDAQELERYSALRGQYLKEELSSLGPDASIGDVRTAYRDANQQALAVVGVDTPAAATVATIKSLAPTAATAPRLPGSGQSHSPQSGPGAPYKSLVSANNVIASPVGGIPTGQTPSGHRKPASGHALPRPRTVRAVLGLGHGHSKGIGRLPAIRRRSGI